MSLVIDASVALKWVLLEPGGEAARKLVGREVLLAPEFLRLECANVLAQRVRSGVLTWNDAEAGLQVIDTAGVRLTPDRSLIPDAQQLAVTLGRSVYDSLYLALAISEQTRLVTADVRFANAAMAHPPCAPSIQLL